MMWNRLARVCLHRLHLKRTIMIALIVGAWLTVVNQGDMLWSRDYPAYIWLKVALNFLPPFVVANLGLLSSDSQEKAIR